MNERSCRGVVRERSEGRCERCGRAGIVTHHHRLKKGQGGPWEPFNIVAACGNGTFPPNACHPFFESHPREAEEEGFHVRPWKNPAEIPILLHGSQWVLLHPTLPQYIDAEPNIEF